MRVRMGSRCVCVCVWQGGHLFVHHHGSDSGMIEVVREWMRSAYYQEHFEWDKVAQTEFKVSFAPVSHASLASRGMGIPSL